MPGLQMKYAGRVIKSINQRDRAKGRASRRRNKVSNIVIPIINRLTGVPEELPVKMKFSGIVTLTGQASAATTDYYMLNAMGEPDPSATSVQPYQFDQLAALYEGYMCYGSKFDGVFQCVTANGVNIVAVRPQNDTTVPTNTARVPERPLTKWGISVAGQRPKRLSLYRAVHRQFGVSKEKIRTDNEYQGSMVTTSEIPSQKAYWMLFSQHIDQTTASTVTVSFTITYYCKLWKRRRVAAS